ncbi:MAG: NAD(P)-dependent oxidoreductase [Novosphingobium sp.]|nr:NAD(P)-dependent oxidoreductase [Novosphingobium sp.]
MNKTHFMGIDVGGSGVRCLLVDAADASCTSASRTWHFPTVEGSIGRGFDLDLEEMWRLIGEASREVIEKSGIAGEQIGSVGVSAMRFGTVIIDSQGKALYAVPNRDGRSREEAERLAAQSGEAVNAETGSWPSSVHLLARLAMLGAKEPATLENADCVFSMSDWVNFKLCGAKTTDYSQAGVTQLFNLNTREWNQARIEVLGISIDVFPPVKPAGTRLGAVADEAAEHTGLSTSTVVGLGGGDTQCSLLGAGAIRQGDIASVAGSTAPVMVVTDKPVVDPQARTWSGHHVVPGLYVLESSGGAMGETLSFMARLFFPDAPEPELRLLAEAEQSEYGAKGMLSSVGAEIIDFRDPAMPAGQITLTHMTCANEAKPRRHICRAIIEGYASAVRANIEQLGEITGDAFKNVFLAGGFSRSDVFGQILADITDGSVTPAGQFITSALGAAICAAVAEGRFEDIAEAAAALTRNREPLKCAEPGRAAAQKVYSDWKTMREAGKDTTAVQMNDYVLSYISAPGGGPANSAKLPAQPLSALITAGFDDSSLTAIRGYMDVEYTSIRETRRILSGTDLVTAMQGKQVLITEVDIVDANALSQSPDLRTIVACRGNAVNVDVEACSAFGVPVLFTPGRNSVAVADLTVGLALALARKLIPAAQFLKDEAVTAGNTGKSGEAYARFQGQELWQKTFGLVGLGAVGRMVAKRLQGFDARLIAADPFATPEDAALAGVELVSLDTLLGESDFVSLHAAVTPSTRNMIGEAEFAKMKKGAFFINTARAQLVDEFALYDALENDTLAGAALDTFLQEPPGFDHPLVQHPKVLSAPHMAGNTAEISQHQGAYVAQALQLWLQGEKPSACLNPDCLEEFSWDRPRREPSPTELEALLKRPAPGVSDLQRDSNAGVQHRSLRPMEQKAADSADASPEIVKKMQTLFERFCASIEQDAAVKKFSADKEFALAFSAPDVDLDFYIALNKGVVAARLGKKKGSVQIVTRAFILDGMFNGTTDTTNAVMKGEISMMGDTTKAMVLQDLQADLARLYKAARSEVGDPGDLESIARPASAVSASAGTDSVPDQRQELLDTVNELYEQHIITATGGNVAVRCEDNSNECWITPSAVFKGDLTPELMVRITLDGEKVDPLSPSPSSEWGFHSLTLKKNSKANAVIHAHAPNATILANCGIPFLPVSSEAAFFGDIKRIPFTMPGSDELAELVSDALTDEWAVFMVNHGVVVAGKSLRRASDMVQIIERTAEVILGCYQATGGKPPTLLPQETIDLFRSMRDVVA